MELNREQIIKALEICAEDTPYPDQSQALLDAIALIKELTEENERLRGAFPKCVEKVYRFMIKYVDKLSDIDELDIAIRLGQIAKEMLEGEK